MNTPELFGKPKADVRCPIRDRRPCRDYTYDCDDMTREEAFVCNTQACAPTDDREGFCVILQRFN